MAEKPSPRSKARRPNVVRNASTRPKGFYAILAVIAVVGASILAYSMTRKPAVDAAAPALAPDLASLGPALRAAKIDPVIAVRAE